MLDELGEADAPTAARAARLAGGRPGVAIAYVRSATAAGIRSEIALTLVDLLDAGRANRLIRGRELLARAGELAIALGGAGTGGAGTDGAAGSGGRASAGRRRSARSAAPGAAAAAGPATGDGEASTDAGAAAEPGAATGSQARGTPAERRRAAVMLLDVWRDVARDLALLSLGEAGQLRQPDLLEDLSAVVRRLSTGEVGTFLHTLDRTAQLLDANANPELVTDVLVLAWPRARKAA